jgi:hypothetical protein
MNPTQCLINLEVNQIKQRSTAIATRWSSTATSTTPPPAENKTQDSKYSATTKKIVYGLAKVMGYYSTGSTAIKASHSLYNICAEQMELNKDFYIKGITSSIHVFRAGALKWYLM